MLHVFLWMYSTVFCSSTSSWLLSVRLNHWRGPHGDQSLTSKHLSIPLPKLMTNPSPLYSCWQQRWREKRAISRGMLAFLGVDSKLVIMWASWLRDARSRQAAGHPIPTSQDVFKVQGTLRSMKRDQRKDGNVRPAASLGWNVTQETRSRLSVSSVDMSAVF